MASYDDIRRIEESIDGIEGVQLSNRHIMSSEVKAFVFIEDGVFFVALVTGTVAIFEVDDGPVAIGVEGVIGEDAVPLLPGGTVLG